MAWYPFRFVALTLVLVGLGGAHSAAAATVPFGEGIDRRFSADAFLSSTSGCVSTFVGVFPVLAITRTPGGQPSTGSSINVQIFQHDMCTNTILLDATNPLPQFIPEGDFEINPSLSRATLRTTVGVCDAVSGSCFPVWIDLSYRRLGVKTECTSQGDRQEGEEVSVFCSAEAEGVVSDGTTNFTPEPGPANLQSHTGFAA